MKSILTLLFSTFSLFSWAQVKSRDTLFFNLDENYVYQSKYVPTCYLLKDSNSIGKGTFFFKTLDTIQGITSKDILCLKKTVRNSPYYNKQKERKLDDDGLFEYFNAFIIFLVKKEKRQTHYIKVDANWEIE